MPAMMEARPAAVRLRVFVVCLCVAVFAWGLQAKLSLYHPAAPLNPEHVAKLTADNQGMKRLVTVSTAHAEYAPKPARVARVAFLTQIRFVSDYPEESIPHAAAPAYTHALLLRPPPSSI